MTTSVPTTSTQRLSWAAFVVAIAGNLAMLYWPRPVDPGGVPHLDKVAHLAAFAAVAWTGLRAGVPAGWLLPVLAVHAVTSELAQAWLLPDRSGDPRDVVADLLGVLAGTVLWRASWPYGRAAPSARGR